MTPVRTPDVVRGDVPGLLCRGMPVHWRDEDTRFVATGAVFFDADDGPWAIATPCEGLPLGTQDHPSNLAVDWSDRAAIYLSLAWLADRGHICTWMLPATHGGKVNAHDGLTAWEVSAILVSRSVVRVARGLGPVTDLVYEVAWGTAGCSRGIVRYLLRSTIDNGSRHSAEVGRRYNKGPRIDERDDMVAKALADGCAALAPSGILLPD